MATSAMRPPTRSPREASVQLLTGYRGFDMSDGYGEQPRLKNPFLYEAMGEILTAVENSYD
jgi:hypothetical protein